MSYGIVLGMMIGDTSYISDKVKQDFQNSGITHMLAVSGTNVAYVIICVKFLFEKLVSKKASNYFVIFFIIIFMFVSGCSASVVRATIMAIILILADLFARKPNIYASIATSVIIMIIYNPLVITDVGFILSYGGTLGIVILYEKLNAMIAQKFCISNQFLKSIVSIFCTTLSAQIILVPIMWYFFNTISIISLVTNLLVAPVSGILTILGIIAYAVGLLYTPASKLLSYGIYSMAKLIICIAKICADVPYANLVFPTPSILLIVVYYLIVYKIFFRCDFKILNYIIYILIAVCVVGSIMPNNCLKINFVDVGQGDCTYIETPNKKTILIDGGGTENSDYDVGAKVLVPYVLDKGKRRIDLIFISHFHEDHVEGIISIIENFDVGEIIIGKCNNIDLYNLFLEKASKKGIEVEEVCIGTSIEIDDIVFDIIYPSKNNLDVNENENSLVLRMKYFDTSMLFTGDLESEGETNISSDIKSNILKVGHHGSKTSTSEEFLKKVSPQIALIGVGKNNSYGHPNDEVLDRLEKINCNIFRTDYYGEIMMKIYKNGKILINKFIN